MDDYGASAFALWYEYDGQYRRRLGTDGFQSRLDDFSVLPFFDERFPPSPALRLDELLPLVVSRRLCRTTARALSPCGTSTMASTVVALEPTASSRASTASPPSAAGATSRFCPSSTNAFLRRRRSAWTSCCRSLPSSPWNRRLPVAPRQRHLRANAQDARRLRQQGLPAKSGNVLLVPAELVPAVRVESGGERAILAESALPLVVVRVRWPVPSSPWNRRLPVAPRQRHLRANAQDARRLRPRTGGTRPGGEGRERRRARDTCRKRAATGGRCWARRTWPAFRV
jgi:hypothetical protein